VTGHQWGFLFDQNIDGYRASRPKRGEYIIRILGDMGVSAPRSILEIGAFSGKDIRYLAREIPDAFCCSTDLEPRVFDDEAKAATSCVVANAFAMPFCDQAYEISFHSGLIICFDEVNASRIIEEQLRVTSRYAIVFGHNRWNFIDVFVSFMKRGRGNSLFRYRRFTKAIFRRISPRSGQIVRLEYTDNMASNFARRHGLRTIAGFVDRFGGVLSPILCNEVVMVISPS
jgi:hypothetical protein